MPPTNRPPTFARLIAGITNRIRNLELTGASAAGYGYIADTLTASSSTTSDLGGPSVPLKLGAPGPPGSGSPTVRVKVEASAWISAPLTGASAPNAVATLFIDGVVKEDILFVNGDVDVAAATIRVYDTDASSDPFVAFSSHTFSLQYRTSIDSADVYFSGNSLVVTPL